MTHPALESTKVKTCACGCGQTFMWRDFFKSGTKGYISNAEWARKKFFNRACQMKGNPGSKLNNRYFP